MILSGIIRGGVDSLYPPIVSIDVLINAVVTSSGIRDLATYSITKLCLTVFLAKLSVLIF